MGGADAARPWHEQAGATFTTVVDSDNQLGRLFQYKIIPNAFFVDEAGRLVGRWIGFSIEREECRAAVDAFRAGTLEPFEREPERTGAAALSPVQQELLETRIRLGAELLANGKVDEAVLEWRKALLDDPGNFVLRKQVWKLRFPEKFLPEIEFDWQKEQLARDQAEEEAMRAAGCGPDGCPLPWMAKGTT